ncbi:MAG: hypothetical protein U0235_23710 [Polyangiaceae bacterium]
MATVPQSMTSSSKATAAALTYSEPPPARRLALLPPSFEHSEVAAAPPPALPLALPEYGWLGSSSSLRPPALSGMRPLSLETTITPTQPAPALVRRATATTLPPPSDGSLICVR